jgi:hypothetical protein
MNDLIAITQQGDTLFVDSRLIAERLGVNHGDWYRNIILKYRIQVEAQLGLIEFTTVFPDKQDNSRGQPKKIALLTESQAQFFLNKSRHGLTLDTTKEFAELGFDFSVFISDVINKDTAREVNYSTKLASKLNGKREVPTLAGNIDVLTITEVIEVKAVKSWKCALGQVLVYGSYYPSHNKRIHLFGETQESFLNMIQAHCSKFKIIVTWEA